jgi:hypothetical protein
MPETSPLKDFLSENFTQTPLSHFKAQQDSVPTLASKKLKKRIAEISP